MSAELHTLNHKIRTRKLALRFEIKAMAAELKHLRKRFAKLRGNLETVPSHEVRFYKQSFERLGRRRAALQELVELTK